MTNPRMPRRRLLVASVVGALTAGLFSPAAASAADPLPDTQPPVLVSISVDKNTIRTSGTIKVTYATQDDTATLQQVLLRYTRPEISWEVDLGGSTLPLSGSFTSSLSESGWPGQLTLKSVEVRDVRGNDAYYWPDGTIRTSGDRITGRHTLDLSHLDVTVVPDKPSLVARSRPQSAEVSWSVGDYEAKGLTGYEVTVNPGGRVIAVPSDKTGYQSIVVTGLTNATKYTFTVRSLSAAGPGPIASATATPLLSGNVFSAGDVNNDRRPDLVAHLPDGPVRVYRGTGPATFGAGKTVVDVGDQRLFPNARLDGRATFLSLSSGTNLQAIHLAWNVTYVGATPIGSGWGMRFIDGSADFTGDGKADIVAVTSGGTANLYRGNGEAGYSHGTRIATGWSTMQTVFASTDVTGDRKADLLGVDKDGVLWIFPGTGKGTFSPKRNVGSGWGGLGALFHAGDVSADGRNDLGAVTMDGTLRVYKGRANGTFSSAVSVSKGWQAYL